MGFRVYRENPTGPQQKQDERGKFEGWSVKFDEWIPVFSPRMALYASKTVKKEEELDLEEDLDFLLKPAAG